MLFYLMTFIHVCPGGWVASVPAKVPALGDRVGQVCRDFEFGDAQFRRFVADHPDTAPVFKDNREFKWMVIWHFAGGLSGHVVYWDNKEPAANIAGHFPTYDGRPVVRITRNQGTVDKCAMLLFELLNRKVDREYELLVESPPNKRKSAYDFVLSCLREEFQANKEVQWFFLQHPIADVRLRSDPYYYNIVCSQYDFREYPLFLKLQYKNAYNPLKFYESVHRMLLHEAALRARK